MEPDVPDAKVTADALKRLDPRAPPPDGAYVDRVWPGSARGWPWPERLRLLLEAGSRPRVLLHGTIGVGKSTELARWAERLEPDFAVIELGVFPSGDEDRVGPQELAARLEQIAGDHFAGLMPKPAMERICDAVDDIEKARGARLVLLLDGIDLLQETDSSRLIGPGTWLTHPDLPPLVVTAPNTLLVRDPNRFRDHGFDTVLHLPPFPVVDASGKPDPAVIDWLAQGLAARFDDPDLFESRDLLGRAALSSGGVPRDAVRILRAALLAAHGAPKVQARHLLEGEREVRQDLEQALRPEDVATLRAVDAEPWFPRDERLVTANAILPYEGEERRYYRVHPLLADVVSDRRSAELLQTTLA